MKSQILARALMLSAAVSLMDAASALAQPAGGAPAATGQTDTLSEVIVTARRVQERLQDVPISITVFNQQQLTNRNITQAQDLANFTPSLSARNAFGSGTSTFAIRGFTQETGTRPSVGVYFADVISPRGSGPLTGGDGAGPGELFDLENVQVLKGPQGTLFGRNTTGGAVLLVPKKPTNRQEGYVELDYGNYDMKRVQAVFNTPITDWARFRLSIDHMSREGYVKNLSGVGPDRFNDVNYTSARASLVLDITPTLENYSIFSYTKSNTAGDAEKVYLCNPNLPPPLGSFMGAAACSQIAKRGPDPDFYVAESDQPNAALKMDQWRIINTTTWKATDNLTVKNIVSYAQFKNQQRSDLFGSNFILQDIAPGLFPPNLPTFNFSQLQAGIGRISNDQSTFTEEFQLQGHAFDHKLVWQGGAYFEYSRPIGPIGTFVPTFLSCSDPAHLQCSDPIGHLLAAFTGLPLEGAIGNLNDNTYANQFHDYGIYAQGTYAITDQLKLTAGIRYTHDVTNSWVENVLWRFPAPNFAVPFCTNPAIRPPTMPITDRAQCTQNFLQTSSAPTWLIDLEYKPVEDIMVYAKYSRGYRQGSVYPTSPQGFNVYQPEKVDTYELGAKTTFRGPIPGSFNITGFYNDFRDQQLQVTLLGTGVPASSAIVNAGKSRMYGAEIEASVKPFRDLTLDLSYAYLNTKILALDIPTTLPPGYDSIFPAGFVGDVLPLSPKHKLVVSATYRLPLADDVGRVSINGVFAHTAEQLVDHGSPFDIIQPTNLLNANLNWDSVFNRPFDFSFFVSNLTGSHYYTYLNGLFPALGWDAAQVGAPRMFGARIRYRFGS
jgi:iron complex outermembrane receptor protein